MKALETSAKAVKKVAAAVIGTVLPTPKKRGDPWLTDDERREAVNDAAARARGTGRFIPRRRDWLKG